MNIDLRLGDCLEAMKEIPDGSVDCIVTSPPYNVNLGKNKYNHNGYVSDSDNMPYDDFLMWMVEVFEGCYRVLADDGRICINIGDGKNGKITTHSDFWGILKDLGFLPIATIVWNKQTTSNRAAWGSFMSASCPSFPSQMEYILVAGKTKRLLRKGKSTMSKREFIDWSNPLWVFPPETKQHTFGHPAMFPVELPYRCINMFSYEGDVVMDPFMGSGTTGVACVNTNRRFIGIEKEPKYYAIAKARIEKAQDTPVQNVFSL